MTLFGIGIAFFCVGIVGSIVLLYVISGSSVKRYRRNRDRIADLEARVAKLEEK